MSDTFLHKDYAIYKKSRDTKGNWGLKYYLHKRTWKTCYDYDNIQRNKEDAYRSRREFDEQYQEYLNSRYAFEEDEYY
jgi:hypothetical protein